METLEFFKHYAALKKGQKLVFKGWVQLYEIVPNSLCVYIESIIRCHPNSKSLWSLDDKLQTPQTFAVCFCWLFFLFFTWYLFTIFTTELSPFFFLRHYFALASMTHDFLLLWTILFHLLCVLIIFHPGTKCSIVVLQGSVLNPLLLFHTVSR